MKKKAKIKRAGTEVDDLAVNPDVLLQEVLDEAKWVEGHLGPHVDRGDFRDVAEELAAKLVELDRWLASGGRLPSRWKAGP